MKWRLLKLIGRVALYVPVEGDVPDPPPFGRLVVGSRGTRAVAVPVTEETAAALWKLGVEAVHPVELDYDWPGGPPFAAQARTVSFLLSQPRCYVFNEMGTGKTRAVAWALDWLCREGRVERVLVLAPLSTLWTVWERELRRMPALRPVVLHGPRERRVERLQEDGWNVAVLNHDGLAVLREELPRYRWDTVVVDEASAFRHWNTRRSRLAYELFHRRQRPERMWVLTGTPMPHGPIDVYGLLRLLKGPAAGRFTRWRAEVAVQVGPHRWEPRPNAVKTVEAALRPAVRYRRQDMYDLPEEQVVDRLVPPTPEQEKLLRKLRREGAAHLQDGRLTVAHAAALLTKILQILQGAVYDDTGAARPVPAGPRFDALDGIVAEVDAPLIVLATYRHVLDLLMERYADFGIARIDGNTSGRERSEIVDAFQRGEYRLLVAHPRTMGHGLTLTRAATVVWFGPVWDAELYEQANARIARPDQRQRRLVVRLAAHRVEQQVYEALARKQRLQDELLQIVENWVEAGR